MESHATIGVTVHGLGEQGNEKPADTRSECQSFLIRFVCACLKGPMPALRTLRICCSGIRIDSAARLQTQHDRQVAATAAHAGGISRTHDHSHLTPELPCFLFRLIVGRLHDRIVEKEQAAFCSPCIRSERLIPSRKYFLGSASAYLPPLSSCTRQA